ncbi:tetratricopeptide repeat protein [Thiovibrio sp. JS02]
MPKSAHSSLRKFILCPVASRVMPICVLALFFLPAFPPVPASAGEDVSSALNQKVEVPARTIQLKSDNDIAWKSLWDEARRLVREGRLLEAVPVYEKLLDARQGLEAAQWELVTLLLQVKKADAAVPHLEMLVETAPGNLQYLLALAETLGGQGAISRSVELYRRARQHDPENLQALSGLASGLVALQKREEALPVLEILSQRAPDRLWVRRELGRLYYELGYYDKARPHLLALANTETADSESLLNAARVLDRLGLENLGVEYWERLVLRDPLHPEGRARLAAYYLKEGKGEAALPYLLPLLKETPSSPQLLKRLGQIYLGMNRYPEALDYFERYIVVQPNDKDVLRMVVDIHAALGNKTQSLLALDRFLSLESEPNLENLAKAAALYEESGGYPEAVALYDRILLSTPDDPEILAKRARALLAAGDDEKANAMWAHLARRQKLLEVLEILYAQDPRNGKVLEKLARMYLDRGDLAKSLAIFSRLSALGVRSPEVRAGEASVYERLNRSEKALALYEGLLAEEGEVAGIRLRCIELAGRLGLQDKVLEHSRLLAEKSEEFHAAPQTRLRIAEALTDASAFSEAGRQYASLLDEHGDDAGLKTASLLGVARLQQKRALPFEAEQALRQAYLVGPRRGEVLARLFSLALAEKRLSEAAVWLDALERNQALSAAEGKFVALPAREGDGRLFRVRLLAAEGQTRAALRLLGQPADETAVAAPSGENRGIDSSIRREAGLLRAELLLAEERYGEAEVLAVSFLEPDRDFATQALLIRIYQQQGRSAEAEVLLARTVATVREDLRFLLEFLGQLQRQRLFPELCRVADEAAGRYPHSVALSMLVAGAHLENGDSRQAIRILQGVVREFPEHDHATALLAQQLFNNGRFSEALALSEAGASTQRPDLALLRARIFWARHDWDNAARAYADFLAPSVQEQIKAQGERAGVALPLHDESSLWRKLTVPEFDRQASLDALMRPERLLSSEAAASNGVVVPWYARYCWQKRFALEGSAREALGDREYLTAATYLRRLLREYPQDASLRFDLAGIYSRFGQLGPEASLYEDIATSGAAFPGVAEARQRNALKRRPWLSVGYGALREEGREGYKAIRKSWEEGQFHYSPYLQEEWTVYLARLEYRDPDRTARIRGNRALVSYGAAVNEHLALRAGGGAEILENGQPDTTVLDLALEGRLSDRLTGTLSYGRDVNHDTLASLGRNIVQQDYKADMVVDLLASVQVGGGYLYKEFSDNNDLQGYDFWAAYLLFFDPAFLRFSYTYDYQDANSAGGGGPMQADGFALTDHPYWTPMNYWQNRFSVYFRHQLSDDQFRRGVPRYYDLEYTLSYDEKGYPIQSWRGGFFVECTPHVMLEATAELATSQEYRRRQFYLGASYRW